MSTFKFAVLPGDGIGPEVMKAALEVLEVACKKHGHSLDYKVCAVGGAGIDEFGKALPDSTVETCKASDAILFGSVGGPKWEHLPPAEQPERAALLPLRKIFKLFANIRPGLLYPQLTDASPLKSERIPDGIDIVCIRELTGGIYFGEKKTWTEPDGQLAACDTMMYRVSEIERMRFARHALQRVARRHKKFARSEVRLVRTRGRHGSRHCGQGHCKSVRADFVGGVDDALLVRSGRNCGGNRKGRSRRGMLGRPHGRHCVRNRTGFDRPNETGGH